MLEAYAGTRSAKEKQQIPTEIQFFLNFYIMIESVRQLSCVWLFETPWTITHQAHPSMGFSRQEYWSGLPCPPPGDLPDPGVKPASPEVPALQVDSLLLSHGGKPLLCLTDCNIPNTQDAEPGTLLGVYKWLWNEGSSQVYCSNVIVFKNIGSRIWFPGKHILGLTMISIFIFKVSIMEITTPKGD